MSYPSDTKWLIRKEREPIMYPRPRPWVILRWSEAVGRYVIVTEFKTQQAALNFILDLEHNNYATAKRTDR